uniref:Uncharacterized protein n=1 Tax=viral metagenome TaxID=1070528 RepID=A0A6M3KZD6_9ZZZZ
MAVVCINNKCSDNDILNKNGCKHLNGVKICLTSKFIDITTFEQYFALDQRRRVLKAIIDATEYPDVCIYTFIKTPTPHWDRYWIREE